MRIGERLRQWARGLKKDVMTLVFACKHPDTPVVAKWLAIATAAYALSPIDLIPDFVPVLGYLDDVIILPVMIYITVRLLPDAVLLQCREEAEAWLAARPARPRSWGGAAVIIIIWMLALGWAWWAFSDEIAALVHLR